MFKMDTEDTFKGNIKPKGDYEVTIDNAFEEKKNDGALMLSWY